VTISLILGSHNHVPLGAGDDEFEGIYECRIKPFIQTLYKYPRIQAVLHYSGVLLHRLERFHPEFFMLIGDLLARKQVELLGGGFYEPMMPLIPLQDKIGQVELLTTYLRQSFGKKPQGCWLPALAWEQNMVSPLNTCGIGYTFLSDNQFLLAGLAGNDLYFPCITEDQGKIIKVFPISGGLKNEFAVKNASDVLNGLARVLPQGSWIVSVFPEELFTEEGAGPEFTFNRFFEELSRCESFVEYTTPGRLNRSLLNLRKAYFPCSMGGFSLYENPRRFLINYPEANGVYSKMVYVRTLINQLRGDKARKRTATEELWKAQGCDLYIPPPLGGICRPGLRKTAYRALLGAEKITREKDRFSPSLLCFDINLDGETEYLLQDEKINSYISGEGAGIFELDYLPKNWNYLETFGERDAEASSPRRRRAAFSDRFLPPDSDPSAFPASLFHFRAGTGPPGAEGARFPFAESFLPGEMDRNRLKIQFTLPENESVPFGRVTMEKVFQSRKDTLTVSYILSNRGGEEAEFVFSPSVDLSFSGPGEDFVRILKGNVPLVQQGRGSIADAESLKFQDLKNEVQITIGSKKPFGAFVAPVNAPCLIKGRTVELYQSTCIMIHVKVTLLPGQSWNNDFTLKFSH
jgi:hypothetical protein